MKNTKSTNLKENLKQVLGGIENIDVLEVNDIEAIVNKVRMELKFCKSKF
ncbi:hypothetical protein HBE96_05050 [Clostridium sp. P21]|uniref:Uncharacterized protein n=1 Tax=Clostridium muellerianum TaxID=2716538 RepID=A0A7Y0EEK1_9CLOT|nr:hypothetical protein [Clostridium muellerianum]NMM62066.1 hypothetical protein [Clostridium muellerianum]